MKLELVTYSNWLSWLLVNLFFKVSYELDAGWLQKARNQPKEQNLQKARNRLKNQLLRKAQNRPENQLQLKLHVLVTGHVRQIVYSQPTTHAQKSARIFDRLTDQNVGYRFILKLIVFIWHFVCYYIPYKKKSVQICSL